MSNRNDPSPEGDIISIFSVADPAKIELVAEVRSGLKHLRGMAFGGSDDRYLIAGGAHGPGVKVFERTEEQIQTEERENLLFKSRLFDIVLPLQRLKAHLKHLWVYNGGDLEYIESEWGWIAEWSHELERAIMGPSYDPPTSCDYVSKGLPAPLFVRIGRWRTDEGWCGCFD